MTSDWSFRAMVLADLSDLIRVQERGAVAALGHVFPQETHPFPRQDVRSRWEAELVDPSVAAYVATDADGNVVGFAARRGDELLHFGTAVETWGSGLATWLHDQLLATYPQELRRLRLRVFAGNIRARRLYERLGWSPTGRESRTSFPPHPVLVEYAIDRPVQRRGT
jgi:RimJ/RimL family protein N-acetyltransferase